MSQQEDQDGLLTDEQVFHPGCGAGTPNACFALARGPKGWQCLLQASPQAANLAGIQLGWRVNFDPRDGRAWCPLGVLGNSKKPPERNRYLFLSYTALLGALENEEVSWRDLESGLFYMGCSSENVFDEDAITAGELAFSFPDLERRREVLRTIRALLQQAKREKRVCWRRRDGTRTLRQLNRLIRKHGYPEINTHGKVSATNFAHVAVQRLQEAGVDLIPIYVY